jgi:hypothetical protein
MENEAAISALVRELTAAAGVAKRGAGYDRAAQYFAATVDTLQQELPKYLPEYAILFEQALAGDNAEAKTAVRNLISLFQTAYAIVKHPGWEMMADDAYIERITPPGLLFNDNSRAVLPALRTILMDPAAREAQRQAPKGVSLSKPMFTFPTIVGHEYDLHTSQEFTHLHDAYADAPTSSNYWRDDQDNAVIYGKPGSGGGFHSKFPLTPEEIDEGRDTAWLIDGIRGSLDPDAFFALLCAVDCLVKAPDYRGWIDLNDLGEMIGCDPRSTADREAMRKRVFGYLEWQSRQFVVGARNVPYYDKQTRKEINTNLSAPIFTIVTRQDPAQLVMFGPGIPARVEVAIMNEQWRALLTHPDVRQFLPLGERLGGIPPGQPSGAWARAIGVELFRFWRRNSKLDRKPTRRELLLTRPLSVADPQEILDSTNPARARTYWHQAMNILAEKGLVERGNKANGDITEVERTPEMQMEGLPRKGWQEKWLDEQVDIRPGADLMPFLNQIAMSRYAPRPRELSGASRKGGRPKKNS